MDTPPSTTRRPGWYRYTWPRDCVPMGYAWGDSASEVAYAKGCYSPPYLPELPTVTGPIPVARLPKWFITAESKRAGGLIDEGAQIMVRLGKLTSP